MRGREGAWVGLGRRGRRGARSRSSRTTCTCGRSRCPRRRSPTTTRASATTPCGRSTTTSSSRRRSTATGSRAYEAVNRRFAEAVCEVAAEGATVWVHDYQLQLVPAMVRELRPDVRIGWFNHIPFPPVELFAQLPWRGRCSRACSAPTSSGSSGSPTPRTSSAPAGSCWGCPPRATPSRPSRADGGTRRRARQRRPDLHRLRRPRGAGQARPRRSSAPRRSASRSATRETLLLGVDRLDYTKGIGHRIKAYGELLEDGARSPRPTRSSCRSPPRAASASTAYRELRQEIEGEVGPAQRRVQPTSARPPSSTCTTPTRARRWRRSSSPPTSLLVTPLRDGMNLVAKEYVTCRHDERRRAGAVGVHRRLPRAAPGLRLQPARHRGPEADDHAGHRDAPEARSAA